MQQNHKVQSEARLEGEQVKLDRRYGQTGISAVKAAVQCPWTTTRTIRRGIE